MIHVVVMKCLIGLPLLVHIELLWGSQSQSFKNLGVGVRVGSYVYRLHSPVFHIFQLILLSSQIKLHTTNHWPGYCTELKEHTHSFNIIIFSVHMQYLWTKKCFFSYHIYWHHGHPSISFTAISTLNLLSTNSSQLMHCYYQGCGVRVRVGKNVPTPTPEPW
jgi:hypothetical protein